jgi:transcriptional pleiotropic regulator of transition state genes
MKMENPQKQNVPVFGGSLRRVDEMGRIVLPRDIRETLGWSYNSQLDVEILDLQEKKVLVREARPRCAICLQPKEDLVGIMNAYICPECLAELRKG